MTIIVCVDDQYGMLFNRRRQSKDSVLRERILQVTGGKRLWMNAYSASQFEPLHQIICVDEDFLQVAGPEDACFVENPDCISSLHNCYRLILYCWNRRYPADTYFPKEQLAQWKLVSTADFSGSSHDMITENVYEKK